MFHSGAKWSGSLRCRVPRGRAAVFFPIAIFIVFYFLSAYHSFAGPLPAGDGEIRGRERPSGKDPLADAAIGGPSLEDRLTPASREIPAAGDPSEMVRFDFEGPVFIEYGKMIKDHSLVLSDGLYHIFYITDEEKSFGHAVSEDLRRWTVLDRVLHAEPDATEIWAPCVVPFEDMPGYWLIYYTAVNGHLSQKTCLAFAVGDLSCWVKAVPERFDPLHPDTSWAHWSEDSWSNSRDPYFFSDGGVNYIIQTAQTKEMYGAISLASSEWYFDWRDEGPLYVHDSWHALESPFLLARGSRYHLFFTEEGVGGISHISSPTLTGGWNIIYRSIIDSGHACEILDLGDGEYLFSRHSSYSTEGSSLNSIRFDTLGWNGDLPEVRIEDPLGSSWSVIRGTAFDRQPVFGDNPSWRGDDTTAVGREGNWWIGTYESFDGPILGSEPGAFQGDIPRGAIRSRTFTVTGRSMRLLVGGGDYPDSCYVALFDAAKGKMVRSETGRGTDLMDERVWDLDPFMGMEVYIEIVDDCSSPFGHINVDDIRESPYPAPMSPDGAEPGPDPSYKDLPSRHESSVRADAPTPPADSALKAHPNPFNPSTTVSFSGVPGKRYTLAVYSMSGARVFSAEAVAGPDGRGSVAWNGRSSGGSGAASGIYAAALCDGSSVVSVCKLVLVR